MPPLTEPEAALLTTVRALPAEGRRAVLSYAMFLRQQEETNHSEADESEWERHFSQPDKMARFAEWAQQSLARHPAEPLDESKL